MEPISHMEEVWTGRGREPTAEGQCPIQTNLFCLTLNRRCAREGVRGEGLGGREEGGGVRGEGAVR